MYIKIIPCSFKWVVVNTRTLTKLFSFSQQLCCDNPFWKSSFAENSVGIFPEAHTVVNKQNQSNSVYKGIVLWPLYILYSFRMTFGELCDNIIPTTWGQLWCWMEVSELCLHLLGQSETQDVVVGYIMSSEHLLTLLCTLIVCSFLAMEEKKIKQTFFKNCSLLLFIGKSVFLFCFNQPYVTCTKKC